MLGVLKKHRIAFIILFLLCLLSLSYISNAKAGVIVVGKVSQQDGTLMLLWYSEFGEQYVIQDYSTIGVDQIHLVLYSPNNLGKTINVTLISYYPIINRTNGKEIGQEDYKEVNISIAIPSVRAVIDKTIDLSPTNRTEKIIIRYLDVDFTFYHKTKMEYLKTTFTIGEYAQVILMHIIITGFIVTTSIKSSKRILDKAKYFPRLSWWHVLLLAGALIFSYYVLFTFAFEIYYRYQYLLIYAIVYIVFLLLSLHTFSPLPKVWLLFYIPKQDPATKTFHVWIRYIAVDYIQNKVIRIRRTWKSFIARAFGVYEYVEVHGYPIPTKEVSNSFDRVIFLKEEPQISRISIDLSALVKILLWLFVFFLAIIVVMYSNQALGILIIIVLAVILLIMMKKGKLSELKQKIGSKIFKEGKTVLTCAHSDVIDMLYWLYNYISTEDIAKAKEINRQKYLKLKSEFEVFTDKKAEQIFRTYKKARDMRFKAFTQPKEPKVLQKEPKVIPEEGETNESEQSNSVS